jgi:hypothetical protein
MVRVKIVFLKDKVLLFKMIIDKTLVFCTIFWRVIR